MPNITVQLAEYEAVIERGLATFVEVGQALADIRDQRLYRNMHSTFEEYCRERWGFSDSRARQLVGAAETVTTVTVEGLPAPKSERVARELASLRSEPEDLRDTWKEATERHGENVTAAQVREVIEDAQESRLALKPSKPPGVRTLNRQRKAVQSMAERARYEADILVTVLDLGVLPFLPPDEREQWAQDLRAGRTLHSQIIAALESGDDH